MASAPATAAAPAAPSTEAEQAADQKRERAGKQRLLVLGAVALAAFAAYFLFTRLTRNTQSTDDAQVEADVVPLAARVGGMVAEVKVADNARVKKGEVIALLDPLELQAKLQQAEGELAAAVAQADAAQAQAQVTEAAARGGLSSARAQVSTTQSQVLSSDAQVANARAQLARAESEAKRTAADLSRLRALFQASAVTQERLDNAQSSADEAQASLQAARAQLAAAEEGKRAAQSRVVEASGALRTNTPVDAKVAAARAASDLARARVTTAEASLALARLNLSYTSVAAPFDGVVTRLTARQGQLIVVGQALAALVPVQTYVVANFKETQVGAMRPGQKVEIDLDAFEGRSFHGVVESLAGGTGSRFSLLPPDNASGNFVKVVQRVPVRIAWTDLPADLPVKAGMSAQVSVKTN
jgi:membrane fusion protein (multidrug efflux system)